MMRANQDVINLNNLLVIYGRISKIKWDAFIVVLTLLNTNIFISYQINIIFISNYFIFADKSRWIIIC